MKLRQQLVEVRYDQISGRIDELNEQGWEVVGVSPFTASADVFFGQSFGFRFLTFVLLCRRTD